MDSAGDRLLIDAHGSAVRTDVVALYRHTLSRIGPLPTLIEWDNDVPDFPTLHAEAQRADAMLAAAAISVETHGGMTMGFVTSQNAFAAALIDPHGHCLMVSPRRVEIRTPCASPSTATMSMSA